MNKQWQATVYMTKEEIPHIVYGDTHKTLQEAACALLLEQKPDHIGSGYNVYKKENGQWTPRMLNASDAKAYASFCKNCLNIQQGPEYVDHGFVDGRFRLEYVKQTGKYLDIDSVNKKLRYGWHILELEKDEQSGSVWYVLGHVEEDAI